MNEKENDWRDEPVLGSRTSTIVQQLLSQLLERVRAARDLPEAIDKLGPMDPSVFERAWVNELIVILNGTLWMFEIIRTVYLREAESTGEPQHDLPRFVKVPEINALETELKPARDKLAAHFFDVLRGGLTVRDYFNVEVSQHTLKNAHDVIESSIEGLWKWHGENQEFLQEHLRPSDLKGKRKRQHRR